MGETGKSRRSGKEMALDGKILERLKTFHLSERIKQLAEKILYDGEIQAMQEYANTVSIVRLKFNDHGPVHTRTVAHNALIMMDLIRRAGVKTSLEAEEAGSFEDSLAAVICGSLLHDLGMAIGRQDHELHSTYLAQPILDRILRDVYGTEHQKIIIIRSLALEAIAGHMGNRSIYSLEAGIVQVADGCDMKKGRARIPLAIGGSPRVGDIHQYSANSIEELTIGPGKEKPISIRVDMSSEVGLFQVEEVLLNKIAAGTAKSYIELYAVLNGGSPKRYL
ncbi:MAG: HD domain-containing protein [Spirochaetaceae bacterium]|jgi:metal-dependent HD superfamily phosphatase/phosphodiesterase|nr:HD domain-containing protein [Spirochaetaceae bacterium]